jgi:glycosyltransferase involved in cell wall biosynthesis
MRVLIDIAGFGLGGAERQTIGLAAGLQHRGHNVLLVINQRADAYLDELAQAPFDVLELAARSGYDVRVARRLCSVVADYRPDVVLCVEFSATAWGRLVAVARRTPVVIAEHLTTKRPARERVLANRLLSGRTAAVVACAQAQVPTLVAAGNDPARIVVVHNGVDARRFCRDQPGADALRLAEGIPASDFVLGIVGRQRPEKRHDRFVRLVEQVGALVRTGAANPAGSADSAGGRSSAGEADSASAGGDPPQVWGLVAGDGPLLDHNRALASKSAAASRIRFLGRRDDLPAVYSACDVVVLVSDDIESFPMVFLEAQACGTPVAGLDVGGVGETFAPGISGVLRPDGDVEGLASDLAELALDPQRRAAMGAAAAPWVAERFSLEKMLDAYERLLLAQVPAERTG